MTGQNENTDNANVVAPPPLIFLTALGAGLVLSKSLGSGSIPTKIRVPAGGFSLAAGLWLMRSFVQAFAKAETPFDPYKPSVALVTDGVYRLSRNPGYLGMVLTCAGISFLTDSPWTFAPLPVAIAVIDRGVIAREERYLERKFGSSYAGYKQRVRRWL